jgi:MSV199 domain
MKRDSFKKLLLKVNTQHSDQIYDYLIAFENNVQVLSTCL